MVHIIYTRTLQQVFFVAFGDLRVAGGDLLEGPGTCIFSKYVGGSQIDVVSSGQCICKSS